MARGIRRLAAAAVLISALIHLEQWIVVFRNTAVVGPALLVNFGGRLADELQLAVAPFFVGDSGAPRLLGEAAFPWNPGRHAGLVQARPIGDAVLLRYALSDRFEAQGPKGSGPCAGGL